MERHVSELLKKKKKIIDQSHVFRHPGSVFFFFFFFGLLIMPSNTVTLRERIPRLGLCIHSKKLCLAKLIRVVGVNFSPPPYAHPAKQYSF